MKIQNQKIWKIAFAAALIPTVSMHADTSATPRAAVVPTYHFYKLGTSQLTRTTATTLAQKFGIISLARPILMPNVLSTFGNPVATVNKVPLVRMGLVTDPSAKNMTLFLQPRLDTAFTKALSLATAATKAAAFIKLHSLVPDSTFAISEQLTWTGQTASPAGSGNPIDFNRVISFRRKLDGLPVYGPSSHCAVHVGATDVTGFSVNVRPVSLMTQAPTLKTQSQIDQEFELATQRYVGVNPTVLQKKLIYFEQAKDVVQPAWLYDVQFTGTGANPVRFADAIVVPLAVNSPEFVSPRSMDQSSPIFATQPTARITISAPVPMSASTTIQVGEYILRNDDDGWLTDAKNFWANLSANTSFVHCNRRDYYWNKPWLWENYSPYTQQSASYGGKDHFVLIEGHGAPWLFSTYKDYGDYEAVHLKQMPGFGAYQAAGEVTSYIEFQGCDIIPEPGHAFGGDFTSGTAWDVWWHLFKGLHACVGYRTLMHIWNGVSAPFATKLAMGCPVAASWLDATNSGYFGHSAGLDYGNVVYVTGHGADTLKDVTPVPSPGSLSMIWCHQ